MNTTTGRIGSIAVVAWALSQAGVALAVTTHWNTNSNGNFNTAADWDNGVPTSADTAVFSRGTVASYTVTLNGAAPGFPPVVHTVDRVVVDSNTVTLARNSLLGYFVGCQ